MPHGIPFIDAPKHVKAAAAAACELSPYFRAPMMEGRYSDECFNRAGKNAPKFTDAEMKTISSPVDFVGINVYIPTLVVKASDQSPG